MSFLYVKYRKILFVYNVNALNISEGASWYLNKGLFTVPLIRWSFGWYFHIATGRNLVRQSIQPLNIQTWWVTWLTSIAIIRMLVCLTIFIFELVPIFDFIFRQKFWTWKCFFNLVKIKFTDARFIFAPTVWSNKNTKKSITIFNNLKTTFRNWSWPTKNTRQAKKDKKHALN